MRSHVRDHRRRVSGDCPFGRRGRIRGVLGGATRGPIAHVRRAGLSEVACDLVVPLPHAADQAAPPGDNDTTSRDLGAVELDARTVRSSMCFGLGTSSTIRRQAGWIGCRLMPDRGPNPSWTDEQRQRVDDLIDEYRAALHNTLDDLTEDEARRRLVPSKTTLLGLLKHATFVEGVWFDQAITGRSFADINIPSTVDRSFALRRSDTIASVQAAHRERCEVSRRALAALPSDAIVDGRGPRPVWALQLQVLRELAHHAGHADILREQILAARPPT